MKFLQLLWCSTICWFLLTGYEWVEILTLGKFKVLFLSELVLFLSAFAFLLTLSNRLFFITLTAQIIEWLILLPEAPNHRWVFVFGAIIILTQKEFEKIGTAFRVLLAIVYFFAGFAKLNQDFLFDVHSCSFTFLQNITSIFPSFEIIRPSIPLAVTILELALPILLILPKTRLLSTGLALALHFGLGLDIVKHFLDFSSVMSCLLITQLIPSENSLPSEARLKKQGKFLALIFLFLVILRSKLILNLDIASFAIILETFWLFYYCALILFFLKIFKTKSFRLKNYQIYPFTITILILAFINGCSPYLGIKTRSSFSMYSNLWIDDSGSNHLIINKSLDILGYLREDIEISKTNDPMLEQIMKNKLTVPYYYLYSTLKKDPYIEVDFQKGGTHISYPKDKLPSPGFIGETWLARKFLIFQASNQEVAKSCIW